MIISDLYRSFNVPHFSKVAGDLMDGDEVGFDAKALVENLDNVLLWDGLDNYALFEYNDIGSYYGHYFFGSARGKQALDLAARMIDLLRRGDQMANDLFGVIHQDNKKAIWLTRQLGFRYMYEFDSQVGRMKVYRLKLRDGNNDE